MKHFYKRRSPSEWSSLLAAYETRDCSIEEFCSLHEVKLNTLKYHLDRLATRNEAFIPVRSTPEPKGEILLELPQGVRLTIRG